MCLFAVWTPSPRAQAQALGGPLPLPPHCTRTRTRARTRVDREPHQDRARAHRQHPEPVLRYADGRAHVASDAELELLAPRRAGGVVPEVEAQHELEAQQPAAVVAAGARRSATV